MLLRAGDRVVGLASADAEAAHALARLLDAYRAPDPSPAAVADEWVRIRVADGIWYVDDARGAETACRSCAEAVDAAEHFVTLRLLDALDTHLHLHAAGCALPAGAVLALGPSGAGKSSLALHWSVTGHAVYGDDIALVDDDAHVHPFKRLFRVHPDRIARYGDACRRLGDPDPDEEWFDPGAVGGWAGPAPVRVLALARYVPGAPLAITRMLPAESLAALLAAVMPTGRSATEGFDTLLGMSARTPMVRVTFGEAAEAADALVEMA
ncbi:MAG TPA: hypothetical protein VJ992_05820 [Gemmatimonadales bacterium]|nr:hypothetical protein [Gemmatimonadales bacterium]